MKKALIFQGGIVDFSPTAFPVSPEMTWVDAPLEATHETHYYNGTAVAAKPPKTQAEIEAEQSIAAKRTLERIDRDSIRSIREYIAAKADAPVVLKDLETAAVGERVKVKV